MSRPRKFTEKRKKLFLQVLSEQANISQACRAVNIDRQTAYNAKEDDAEFAEAWDNAHEQAIDRLEAEAWRRAHDGFREPVYYQGEPVGYIRKYSDRLMELLLTSSRPEKYKQRWQGDINATGNLKLEIVDYATANEDPDTS